METEAASKSANMAVDKTQTQCGFLERHSY